MKTTLFTLLLLTGFFAAFAQVPNGGFETWTGNDPDGWVTTNGLMQLGNPKSVYQSTDAHSGSSACEIRTINVVNKIPGVGIPDYTGSIFTGKQVFTTSYFGFPYTSKPGMLRFWYKYNARNKDTASVLAYTTRWNAALNKRDTLAITVGLITDSVGVYTQKELPFYVMDSLHAPDSAVVLFASSSIYANKIGAILLLDDVAFAGGNVGLAEKGTQQPIFHVFPNPVTGNSLSIQVDQPAASVKISLIDMQGRTVLDTRKEISAGLVTLNTNTLVNGVYMLYVQTEQGNAFTRLVIE